jgi:predicted glycosyltransferase involved in capsule biosynthesis
MTTDADIFFAKEFFELLINSLDPKNFIESRTMYWKNNIVSQIYNGTLDPFNNLNSCRIGRIKKRTTPGGCQCGHISMWKKVRGYDERYLGWGSEDVDLLARISRAGYGVKWLGEDRESIMVFHQPHDKIDHEEDMRDQNINLGYYRNITTYEANPNGWGGSI